MEILGFIPARGGSKSIPHKNIVPLGGQPLIVYTFRAAKASRRLTRVLLSTDDPAIAKLGKKFGIEIPFMRPAHLAKDKTPMKDVIKHALKVLKEKENYKPDLIVLLQPTSPLREAKHIDAAVDLLLKTGADSVVSVTEVPHQFNPVSLMKLKNGKLISFAKGPLILRRQDKPKLYARNGPAVFVAKREVFARKDSLFGGHCRPFFMNPESSIDVDEALDLKLAEFFLGLHRKKK